MPWTVDTFITGLGDNLSGLYKTCSARCSSVFVFICLIKPCYVGLSLHGMARSREAGEGDGFQICSVAASMRIYPKVSGLAAWSGNCKW
jgi:hypothetical protein